jgi:hypothetical protein
VFGASLVLGIWSFEFRAGIPSLPCLRPGA